MSVCMFDYLLFRYCYVFGETINDDDDDDGMLHFSRFPVVKMTFNGHSQ